MQPIVSFGGGLLQTMQQAPPCCNSVSWLHRKFLTEQTGGDTLKKTGGVNTRLHQKDEDEKVRWMLRFSGNGGVPFCCVYSSEKPIP